MRADASDWEAELGLQAESAGARARLLRWRLFAVDVAAAVAAAIVGVAVSGFAAVSAVAFVVILVAVWAIASFAIGLYSVDRFTSWATGLPDTHKQLGLAGLLTWPLYGLAVLLHDSHPMIATPVVALALPLLVVLGRGFVRAALHRRIALRQRTVIVGSGEVAEQLIERIGRHRAFGLEPVGIVDDDPHTELELGLPVLGGLRDLRAVIAEHDVQRVIIAFTRASHEGLLDCLRACRDQRVAVDVVPRLFEFLGGARSVEQLGDLPMLSIGVTSLSRPSRIAKRLMDVAFASIALLLSAPLFALVALAIKLESRGPVLFRQTRAGRDGRPFRILKFRSMYADADRRKAEYGELNDHGDGVMFKIHEDPRITRGGRFLRRTSLDELPQLINVIRGDMSIVGPRPLILQESDAFGEQWHARRLDLRPGLTGPWQISGRSNLGAHEMLRLDFQYVTGWTLARDVEIMLATVPAVLAGHGAY